MTEHKFLTCPLLQFQMLPQCCCWETGNPQEQHFRGNLRLQKKEEEKGYILLTEIMETLHWNSTHSLLWAFCQILRENGEITSKL